MSEVEIPITAKQLIKELEKRANEAGDRYYNRADSDKRSFERTNQLENEWEACKRSYTDAYHAHEHLAVWGP